jgi:ABC-type branched-subunit amino acid transport system permease subunit
VLVVAPLLGWVLDRALYRHLRTANAVAKLVTTLGLLVAIPQITRLWLGTPTGNTVKGLWPWEDETGRPKDYRFGDVVVNGDRLAAILATLVVVVFLTILFRRSSLGLRMRATVESPRMTELSGIRSDRISAIAWMMSSVFAGMAGVLLAPLFGGVNDADFFFLLLAALAAAAFGSLKSIPMTFAGGLLLGVGYQLLNKYLDPASILSTGLKPSLPFLALFLLLLFWPGLRTTREQGDPLAGVDPPPPAPAASQRTATMTTGTRVLACVAILFVCTGVATFFDVLWVQLFTGGVVYAVIFLSITVITGMAGLLSLSQATFAAIGAITTAQLVDAFGFQVLLAAVIGGLVAALVGGLFALPVMRLGGLYLALATLAFAAMFQSLIFPQDWAAGDFPDVPRPILGPFDFSDNRAYFFLVVVILAATSFAVYLVKRGTTGRYLDALRGSEVAAASIGVDPRRARITAFALSAGIAGLGGGLLAIFDEGLSQLNFQFIQGLFWVVLVVTLGARSIQAAIMAGISFKVFPELLSKVHLDFLPDTLNPAVNSNAIAFILFGLGALTYAKHPEGIIEHQTTKSMAFVNRVILRRPPEDDDVDDDAATTAEGPADPVPA